jgi:hypothetical protein
MNHAHFTVYRKMQVTLSKFKLFHNFKKKKWKNFWVWHRLQQRAHSCFFPARQLAGKDEREDEKKVFKKKFLGGRKHRNKEC